MTAVKPGSVHAMRWRIPADPKVVIAILADASRYPGWWPFFRTVDRDGDGYRVAARGLRPLSFVLHPLDADAGVVAWRLSGDLNGTWTLAVTPHDGGAEVAVEWRVRVNRRFGPLQSWTIPAMLARGETSLILSLEESNRLRGDIPSKNDEVTASSVPLALAAGATALAVLWWRRRG